MFFQKLLKLFMVIGLLGLLFLLTRKKMGLVNRAVVLFSDYRHLLPYTVAHAKVESANFTSKVYITDHNMFGMKWTNGRRGQNATQGLKSPEGDYYAHYASDSASLMDLILWFKATKFPTQVKDAAEYVAQLKQRGYFGGDQLAYQKNLEYWLKS